MTDAAEGRTRSGRSPAVPAPALRTVDLVKEYAGRRGLDGVSLEVARGERVMLVGPNGSGKSTLLKTVSGLLEPTAGEARVLGAVVGTLEARAVTAFLGDEPVLYDDLSVLEHCLYLSALYGVTDGAERADYVLGVLGLDDRRDELPGRLSRGLRQRAAAACGLVRPFRLLLVDEPFVGLDRPGREALLRLMTESAEAGAAVVVATHQGEALRWADRLVGLMDGAVVYDGAPSEGALRGIVGG